MIASLATLGAVLVSVISTWFAAVGRVVEEPYIDEIFHLRQGGEFCNGRFGNWNPKITTPPGVYLLSYVFSPILGCSDTSLRLMNAICMVTLFFVVYAYYFERLKSNGNETGLTSRLLAQHSALNIALFPPLFTFSALYYTDVASTLSVVVFNWYLIRQLRSPHQINFGQATIQVLLGVISLLCRQTNIFWTAVFPIGLVTVHELNKGHKVLQSSMYRRSEGFGDSFYNIAKTTWKMDVIYDPPVRYAFFEDYSRTLVSIITRCIKVLTEPSQIPSLIRALSPFLALIVLFGAFIIWNDGVVLGDKSAHVATINSAQILYFWPYTVLFSWPLLLPHMFIVPLMIMSRMSQLAHFEPLIFFRRHPFLPRLSLFVGFIALFCVIAHFNTVVHPYNLADNRHYPFYVLRRLINPWWVRYAVTPIYAACGWACLETRGESAASFNMSSVVRDEPNREPLDDQSPNSSASKIDESNSQIENRPLGIPDGTSTASTSFVIIFLVTSALQLCTSLLVEPRYFIIPWLMWRMHLPLFSSDRPKNYPVIPSERTWKAFLGSYDHRVTLETLWHLTFNAVLGYVFLYRTFEWESEPGEVQRFIW